ncbi:MAG: hypothetical protein F6K00_30805 [Leptolyngbya sp. SIOISBB]|nr:hypothetical protein [Leptolyngbya sp. SIOISBB]
MDDQIKLRGYRIEPGEIEAALCQHPDVEQAVVIRREDLGAAAKLVAYVVEKVAGIKEQGIGNREQAEAESFEFSVLNSQFDTLQNSKLVPPSPVRLSTHAEAHPLSNRLHQFLADKLPAYMRPDHFVILEALPLTVNGKVDRQALPLPQIEAIANGVEHAPSTEAEQQLAAVWAEVLQRDAVGIHDNFF